LAATRCCRRARARVRVSARSRFAAILLCRPHAQSWFAFCFLCR
jgi:hypothetical protein